MRSQWELLSVLPNELITDPQTVRSQIGDHRLNALHVRSSSGLITVVVTTLLTVSLLYQNPTRLYIYLIGRCEMASPADQFGGQPLSKRSGRSRQRAVAFRSLGASSTVDSDTNNHDEIARHQELSTTADG